MNAAALLTLIGELYEKVASLAEENAGLRAQLATAQAQGSTESGA